MKGALKPMKGFSSPKATNLSDEHTVPTQPPLNRGGLFKGNYMSAAKKRRKINQRAKKKPEPVSLWDNGATGLANKAGLVIEDRGHKDLSTGKTINPNNVKGARRIDILEKYHKLGWISSKGYTAAERLRDAWENTQRGPGWADNDRVQSSPDHDKAISIKIDRIGQLAWVSSRVPIEHAEIIEQVVIFKGSITGTVINGRKRFAGINHDSGKRALREGLDALADNLGH